MMLYEQQHYSNLNLDEIDNIRQKRKRSEIRLEILRVIKYTPVCSLLQILLRTIKSKMMRR
jgi:hypothetical protein